MSGDCMSGDCMSGDCMSGGCISGLCGRKDGSIIGGVIGGIIPGMAPIGGANCWDIRSIDAGGGIIGLKLLAGENPGCGGGGGASCSGVSPAPPVKSDVTAGKSPEANPPSMIGNMSFSFVELLLGGFH
jgi:hypothetical protein